MNRCNQRGASTSANDTLLALSYTWVKAVPSLSGSPRKVMVSASESNGGISTDTPENKQLNLLKPSVFHQTKT
jgi:hypothetical protein